MAGQKILRVKDMTPEQRERLSKYGGWSTPEGTIINTPEQAEAADRMFDRQNGDD